MRRDLYAVLVTSTNPITPRAYSDDTHSLVSDLVTRLILANNHPVTPEDIRADLKPISDDLGRYEVGSWDAQSRSGRGSVKSPSPACSSSSRCR
jgi:hypothetical protein